MRIHTNDFKQEISLFGRQIDGRIDYYLNFNLITESGDTILTEDNLKLITEQPDKNSVVSINGDDIFSIDIIKNGSLLHSLMKELDFESKVELKVGTYVNPKLGVLVNGDYEYLNYGDYIIYSKEFNAEMNSYIYKCYDLMLFSMIKYRPLNISYPITIRDYITALAEEIGLTFANSSDNFVNYNQLISKDVFKDLNLTYRDVLDQLSQITASNILINDDNELEVGYPSETNDTIDESNLKDINVTFGETFGPINKITANNSDSDIIFSSQDTTSIENDGLTQININDNLLILNGDTQNILDEILNQLKGLAYSINDFSTVGVCYYDFLDLFNVEARGNTYQCLLLNNEIHITQGIQETIFTYIEKNTETDSKKFEVITTDLKTVSFKIDQQNGKIESKVEKDGVISAINQSAEQVSIDANKINLNGVVTANDNFKILLDGSMQCTNANMSGTITSSDGTIGGWTINVNGLTNGTVFIHKDGSSTLYTVADLFIMRAYIMGLSGFDYMSPQMIAHYDLNNDGRVDATDYVTLQNLIGIPM